MARFLSAFEYILTSYPKSRNLSARPVYRYLNCGNTITQYYEQYKVNKSHNGRQPATLPSNQVKYIRQKVGLGWTPDIIIGRGEVNIDCSMRTLYRMFKRGQFDVSTLPMKGKRHPNGYVEHRGKAGQLGRSVHNRKTDYPKFRQEFGHLEGDTVQGRNHQGAVTTLVERLSKVEIVLNSHYKSADAVTSTLRKWLQGVPRHLFKSITFDNGKEFANWRAIANEFDLNIYFADVGAPNQRGLNENNNGLLRRGHVRIIGVNSK